MSTSLELDPNPSLTRFEKELQTAWFKLLDERSGALVPSRKEAEAALKETKRLDFRESDEALAKLAEKAGTLYATFVSLQYTAKKQLVLQGRVVRDDGKLMKTARVELPKGDETIVNRFTPLAELFFADLALSGLPTFKEAVKTVEPVVVVKPPDQVGEKNPPPPPPPIVPVDTGEGQRTAGQVLLIGGAGVAVVGAVLLGAGQGIGGSLGVMDGNIPADKVNDYRTAQTLTGAGLVTLGVGAAAALVGGIVWATAPAAPVKVTAVPTAGGAMFGIQGEF
ncbi:MAG: hypothetical protein ACOZQL_22375 [Myxococcota bacterium]